jgi:hypothetical protein
MSIDLEERLATALVARAARAQPVRGLDAVLRAGARPTDSIDPGRSAAWRGSPRTEPGPPAHPDRHPSAVGGAAGGAEALRLDRRRRRPRVLLAVAVAAAVVSVGAVGFMSSRSGRPRAAQPGTEVPPSSVPRFSWETRHASLAAESITIEYLGQTFNPDGAEVQVESYLGTQSSELLKLSWAQHGIELGWELNFTLRGDEWWVDQMSVLDDRSRAEGNPQTNEVAGTDTDGARVPLGEALGGDLDVELTDTEEAARVVVTGIRLVAFRDRLDSGGEAALAPTPPVLVAAPPLPADVRPTGMYSTAEEWMAVLVAHEEITRACMSGAGVDYPPISDDVLIQTRGQFSITAGVSVHGRAAAAATGYHTVNDGILNGGVYLDRDEMSTEEQDAYNAGLRACLPETAATIGDLGAQTPMRAWEVVGDVRQQAFDDPDVIRALDSWRECVSGAVGERAHDPNELARLFAFTNGDPWKGTATDHEKAVAVADFDCQQQVDYETVWHTAVVERERAAMGDRVGEYDQWVRDYQAMITRAQQVLGERGIVLPSLD